VRGSWKAIGLAGLAGVAATGAVLVRAERRRQALTPEDVRARLHARYAEVGALGEAPVEAPGTPVPAKPAGRWRRRRRSRPGGRRVSGGVNVDPHGPEGDELMVTGEPYGERWCGVR
jgi:hypothetical protein